MFTDGQLPHSHVQSTLVRGSTRRALLSGLFLCFLLYTIRKGLRNTLFLVCQATQSFRQLNSCVDLTHRASSFLLFGDFLFIKVRALLSGLFLCFLLIYNKKKARNTLFLPSQDMNSIQKKCTAFFPLSHGKSANEVHFSFGRFILCFYLYLLSTKNICKSVPISAVFAPSLVFLAFWRFLYFLYLETERSFFICKSSSLALWPFVFFNNIKPKVFLGHY